MAGKHQQKNTHQKIYQTCSPLELAGWEKKESKKVPKKKYEGNFGIRMIKVKMKKGKNGWKPLHTHSF